MDVAPIYVLASQKRSISSGGRALPWHGGMNAPSRKRQASPASPTSSVTSKAVVNYNAILKSNKRNPKNKVRRYAKKWLDVNLPIVIGFSDRTFRMWSKLLHPDKENQRNTNRIARRTALMKLVSRIHQNAKRGRF